jgi:hypothetical protein
MQLLMFSSYDESLVQAYQIRAQLGRYFADVDVIPRRADSTPAAHAEIDISVSILNTRSNSAHAQVRHQQTKVTTIANSNPTVHCLHCAKCTLELRISYPRIWDSNNKRHCT